MVPRRRQAMMKAIPYLICVLVGSLAGVNGEQVCKGLSSIL